VVYAAAPELKTEQFFVDNICYSRSSRGHWWVHEIRGSPLGLPAVAAQIDKVEVVADVADTPSDPAVVVLNPDDEVTPESVAAWLNRRQAGEPVDPGVRTADTLAQARAAGEV
jgi:hypothetical protein